MPQTGTTEGHAHLYEVGGTRTTATNGHWHRLRHGHQITGPEVPIGTDKAVAPFDSHTHDVEG